jgi:hypothetical protein
MNTGQFRIVRGAKRLSAEKMRDERKGTFRKKSCRAVSCRGRPTVDRLFSVEYGETKDAESKCQKDVLGRRRVSTAGATIGKATVDLRGEGPCGENRYPTARK